MTEYRRILLDGYPTQVRREGEALVCADGREVAIADAIHLPPVEPTKIIAVHLNYAIRTEEFMTKLPAAPTYFHKPITALNSGPVAVWSNENTCRTVRATGSTCHAAIRLGPGGTSGTAVWLSNTTTVPSASVF